MKLSERWLRKWVNPPISLQQIAEQLTLAGLESHVIAESESRSPFTRVIVGEIVHVTPHPKADRLHICEVLIHSAPETTPVSIICGATNVQTGLKVAVALPGATLPSGFQIQSKPLRGVMSHGMLCSTQELGVDFETESTPKGIWELPADLPLGIDLWEYLQLEDQILDIQITPNRGDCLSILGIAREIAALNQVKLHQPPITPVAPTIQASFPIHIEASNACPLYLGRLIRGLNSNARTPLWMEAYLKRLGHRSHHPIVDITNYVLLELGAPLHAFDLNALTHEIQVRLAHPGESITLLNQQEIKLQSNTLLISDKIQPHAMAGIMGGQSSAVSDTTTDIFLEAAFFTPTTMTGKARQYGLTTEANYRFERGVDPTLCRQAMERATQLILEICASPTHSCDVGPIMEHIESKHLPKRTALVLRSSRIHQILGIHLPESTITQSLISLGMHIELQSTQAGVETTWHVRPPSWRFDLAEEVDLIEEIARVYGYHNLSLTTPQIPIPFNRFTASPLALKHFHPTHLEKLRDFWTVQGYTEIVNYSFTSLEKQKTLNPSVSPLSLTNPISSELSALRTGLNLSLIQTAVYNQNRQQTRLRLFEIGSIFLPRKEGVQEELCLGGISTGNRYEEQWGLAVQESDLFDIKSCIENSLKWMDPHSYYTFRAISSTEDTLSSLLHSVQASHIMREGHVIGYLGALHPKWIEMYGLTGPVYLFEWQLKTLEYSEVGKFKSISRLPSVRRDISFWISHQVPLSEVRAVIQKSAGPLLRDCHLFDLYPTTTDAETLRKNLKSLTLKLIWQPSARSLNDSEIEHWKTQVLAALQETFQIQPRE